MAPSAVVAEVEASGIRGRGGAGFPSGRKWRAAAAEPAAQKYVVANGDEGDAGAYVDRFLMEDDPFALLEAMAIAGHAVGATRGYVYVRVEYPAAIARLRSAIDAARAAGFLGPRLDGGDAAFDVEIVVGAGSYVCGEETALLNSIEGKRPEVRARPPYPTQSGLWGKPTLVHNVETLANLPWIVARGAAAYRAIGYSTSFGTKVVSLNSLFARPGLYEIDFGTPVRAIVEEIGGGLRTGSPKGVIIGGPLAGILPPSRFDTPFAFDELRAAGGAVGHGGVVAFDDRTSIVELLEQVFAFGAYESCGKCTPCRLGSRRAAALAEGMRAGARAPRGEIVSILQALADTSLCGHGTGLAEFGRSVLEHYAEELSECLA
jgi:formate dehydrogenase iron-sulfur subunit